MVWNNSLMRLETSQNDLKTCSEAIAKVDIIPDTLEVRLLIKAVSVLLVLDV
jgi:hypothetical protein